MRIHRTLLICILVALILFGRETLHADAIHKGVDEAVYGDLLGARAAGTEGQRRLFASQVGETGIDENTISYGETVSGRITGRTGDEWHFLGEADDIVTIEMRGDTLVDTYLELFAPDGALLIYDDDGGPDLGSLIAGFPLPTDGEYTILARGYDDETGTYTLTLSSGITGPESKGFIRVGGVIDDAVEDSFGDEWLFSGEAGDVVSIEMNGITLDDAYIELFGPDGERLASDDDGGADLNALLNGFILPESGNYSLIARGYAGNTGTYTLRLLQGAMQSTEAGEDSLNYGSIVNGQVVDADGQTWSFAGQAGDVVTIELNGITLEDPYLSLYAPDGALEASDDDGGTGLNGLIDDYVLSRSGRYTIIASGFGSHRGTYTLTLRGAESADANSITGPPIASIDYPACGAEATYFVLSFDGPALENHDFYRVSLDALGDGAAIRHFSPVMGIDLSAPVAGPLVVDIAGVSIDLAGMSSVEEIRNAISAEIGQQGLPGAATVGVTLYDTADQPQLAFVIGAMHPNGGGVSGLVEWQRTSDDALAEQRIFINCE